MWRAYRQIIQYLRWRTVPQGSCYKAAANPGVALQLRLNGWHTSELANPLAEMGPARARISFAWAALALSILLLWQFLTVRYNWGGNWTALFCTGQAEPIPPALQTKTYRFPNSTGYDGQMYRYVAHDPLRSRGYQHYVDAPRLRYRRILVPGLAFAFAGGQQDLIDQSYIAVTAMFVLLGAYWLSRWATLNELHAAWGLAFLLLPATLISMDRMTVDGSLAALSVAFAYFLKTRSTAKLYVVLVLACLVRETGVLLVGGCCISELVFRRFTRAALWGTACLPALAWYWFLDTQAQASAGIAAPRWFLKKFGFGLIGRLFDPPRYPLSSTLEWIARSADVVALAGILCALIVATVLLRVRPLSPITITAGLYVALAIMMTSTRYWNSCYTYSRAFSPLLIFIALETASLRLPTRAWRWGLVPMVLVDLRIGLQMGPQLAGVVRGLSGH